MLLDLMEKMQWDINYRIYLDQYFTEKGRAFDCIGNFYLIKFKMILSLIYL
jgi:hypothetical protein